VPSVDADDVSAEVVVAPTALVEISVKIVVFAVVSVVSIAFEVPVVASTLVVWVVSALSVVGEIVTAVVSSAIELLPSAAVADSVARVLVSITLEEASISIDVLVLESAVSMVIAVVVAGLVTFVSEIASLSVDVVSKTIVSEPVENGAEIDVMSFVVVVKTLEPNCN